MKLMHRAAPVLFGALVLLAAACTPPPTGGGGNLSPIAVASATPISGNAPLAVTFDGSGSSDPDGTIASYAWAFGNSTSGTGVSSSTTYVAGGVYTATLTVTDNGGKTATSSVTITVNGDGDGDGFFVPADCDDSDDSIYPGAPDAAGDDIDQNCDGIDGEQADAVFVSSSTGANTSTCGTILEPCASIGQGQTRALAEAKSNVFVAGGSYAKFSVAAGLEVRGGYGQNWQRGVQATGATSANVTASFDAAVGGPVGIIADGITTATRVADLKVTGATAAVGQNSYGVVVRNSSSALVLDALDIVGGTAGNGANGANGAGGWGAAANAGGGGQAGFEPGGMCNTSAAGAGGGGATGVANGGAGGKGGAIDTDCGQVFPPRLPNYNAQPGNNGAAGAGAGAGAGGGGGLAGTSGLPGICNLQGNVGQFGSPGASGANGASGGPGSGGAAGAAGIAGGLGTNGAGGGGGGGGGAADCGVDDAGAGGGGGGAGGARAATPGAGGAAGAQSIAIRLENSSPVLTGIEITLGVGGAGGNGGAGAPRPTRRSRRGWRCSVRSRRQRRQRWQRWNRRRLGCRWWWRRRCRHRDVPRCCERPGRDAQLLRGIRRCWRNRWQHRRQRHRGEHPGRLTRLDPSRPNRRRRDPRGSLRRVRAQDDAGAGRPSSCPCSCRCLAAMSRSGRLGRRPVGGPPRLLRRSTNMDDLQMHDVVEGHVVDVAVVGAGLAGLSAAITAARTGARVAILDAGRWGGRARASTVEPGVVFNGGPRALYRDGAAARELAAMGIRWRGAPPRTRNARVRAGDTTHVMPATASQLLRSGALGVRGTIQLGRLMSTIGGRDPEALVGRSVAEWVDEMGLAADARAVVMALVRLSTYVDAPEVLDAGAAASQLQLASGGVHYLDGGWQTLVDQMVDRAADLGVAMLDHTPVRSIERRDGVTGWVLEGGSGTARATSVVLATGTPAAAARLSPIDLRLGAVGDPVTAACLELAVRGPLRVPFLLGLDVPLYLSQHSPPAALAPEGISVVHVLRYGTTDPASDRAELWEHVRRARIDRAAVVADRFLRRMVVAGGLPRAADGGVLGRPSVTVLGVEGLHLAGDWVGGHGLLADAAVASGVAAGRAAAQHTAWGATTSDARAGCTT